MYYPVLSSRPRLAARALAGLAFFFALSANPVFAQPHASAPAASAPASPASSAAAPGAPSAPASSGDLFAGVAATVQPAPPPRLPMSFDSFGTDFQPPKNMSRRWLTVRVGYVELDQPPPTAPNSQGTPAFTVVSLPTDVLNRLHFVEFVSLIGSRSRYENVNIVDHDPHGVALPFALPMGRIVYFLARQDTPDGIDFDFYYYDANSLTWNPSPVDFNLLLPQPVVTIEKQSLVVPADRYVMMPTSEHMGPVHPGSTARQVMLYGYVVLNLHFVEGPSAATSPAPGVGAPAPSGDVLSAPPTNPGTPLMQNGPAAPGS